jgi:N-methylhydantoinase A
MLMADVRHDYARTLIGLLDQLDSEIVRAHFAAMREQGDAALLEEGFGPDARSFLMAVDMRYVGQEHSVRLAVAGDFSAAEADRLSVAFAEAHERAYGHTMPDPIEVVAVRLSAIGHQARPEVPPQLRRDGVAVGRHATRPVVLGDGSIAQYAVYHRDDFRHGDQVAGPAIIGEHTGTTVLHQGDDASIGAYGEIVIKVGRGS